MNRSDDHSMDGAESGFPWTFYTSIALKGLHWSPETFWQSTPREVCMAFAVNRHMVRPLNRAILDELQHAFPDEGQPQQL